MFNLDIVLIIFIIFIVVIAPLFSYWLWYAVQISSPPPPLRLGPRLGRCGLPEPEINGQLTNCPKCGNIVWFEPGRKIFCATCFFKKKENQ